MEHIATSNDLQADKAIGADSVPTETLSSAVRVWLVDDNDQLRTLVAEVLSQLGGIECARHFSSPDALLSALASKPGPDVILLDVQMGDRNGLDAVRPIKSLTRSTRVLMFTTSYNRDWRKRALDDGASDYLLKTETMERVAARIRNPADDPAPGFASRRRASCPPERTLKSHQTSSITDRSPRLLSRTLKLLRLFSN
jgi:DNA-binding NarL/FixJ family response regulator